MKATFGHQIRAPTELINDNTVSLSTELGHEGKIFFVDRQHTLNTKVAMCRIFQPTYLYVAIAIR